MLDGHQILDQTSQTTQCKSKSMRIQTNSILRYLKKNKNQKQTAINILNRLHLDSPCKTVLWVHLGCKQSQMIQKKTSLVFNKLMSCSSIYSNKSGHALNKRTWTLRSAISTPKFDIQNASQFKAKLSQLKAKQISIRATLRVRGFKRRLIVLSIIPRLNSNKRLV